MKNRLDYVDVAKGLGMLAIIWGHICCKGWSNELVYSFHIPLFFFISGLLYNNEKYKEFLPFVKARAKRLLLPYVAYSVITWLIWVGYTFATNKPVESYWMPLLQTVIAKGSGGYLVHNVALWFIPCLFAVEIIYYFIGKFKWSVSFVICCTIALVSIFLEARYGRDYLDFWPWNLDSAFMALPFYCIGNGTNRLKNLYDKVKNNTWLTAIIVVVLTSILVVMARRYGAISMGHSIFGNEYIFHIRGLIGCFSTLFFSMLLCAFVERKGNKKIIRGGVGYLKWFGINSLDVMATNNPLKGVVCTVIALLMHIKTNDASFVDIPTSLLAFVITLVIDTLLVWLIVFAREKHWFLPSKQTDQK